ncbi:proline racemase family protein [Pseudovibrio denitrificans]|uniref:proline racemase family protein n=1 Tax=Pseudovibrio denitrificans TaxID=258256 RepID=UPI004032C9DA
MKLNNMITVVGAHAEGEVGRVITGGLLPPPGATMLDKLINMENNMDWVRQMLLSDPRGSVNTSVNYITPPCHPDADFGMIVMESDYYVHMSGSNLICTVTTALETGMVPMAEPFTKVVVDTPAGLVHVTAECENGKCRRISFDNIPSFVMHRDRIIDVPGFGSRRVDVSYGGMIYVIAEAAEFGFSLHPSESRDLVEIGEILKKAAAEQLPSVHPEIPEIHTVNQTQFTGPLETKDGVKTSKNAVIVSPGRLDRCPCAQARQPDWHCCMPEAKLRLERSLFIAQFWILSLNVKSSELRRSEICKQSSHRSKVVRGSPGFRSMASILKTHSQLVIGSPIHGLNKHWLENTRRFKICGCFSLAG